VWEGSDPILEEEDVQPCASSADPESLPIVFEPSEAAIESAPETPFIRLLRITKDWDDDRLERLIQIAKILEEP
jgi:hypothetical protein